MLRIGAVELETNLLLAPIAGYCDLAFRLVVRSLNGLDGLPGVGLACTDLLCPQAVLGESTKSKWLTATCPEDQPLCMQLYGAEPYILAEAAQWAQQHGAATIDINMGCPVDKITKQHGGSKLLCDLKRAVRLARHVVRAVTIPVTAKIRLGWDDRSHITNTLPVGLADIGIAAVTVHGRTAQQKFRGTASLDGIARVVASVGRCHKGVPVIGNGDIKSPLEARHMLMSTGCAGVMIGRGALGQPWIFRDTASLLATGRPAPPLSRSRRVQVVLDHFDNLCRYRSSQVALKTLRQRISWYSPYLQPWPGLRRQVRQIESPDQFRQFMSAGMDRIEAEGAGHAEYTMWLATGASI